MALSDPFAALKRFAEMRPGASSLASGSTTFRSAPPLPFLGEGPGVRASGARTSACELCGEPIGEMHGHVLDVVAAKYLRALPDGEVPLLFLFSGTVLYGGEPHGLQIAPISWEREARFRMPVALWQELMERYFPGSAWLRIGREQFDRLCSYKAANALPDWDAVMARLLPPAAPLTAAWHHSGRREDE